MPTQPLCGSVTKLFSHKFLRLRGSAGGLYATGRGVGLVPSNILIKPLLLKSCEGYRYRQCIGLPRLNFSYLRL
ncbi:hypothetical protein GW17_00028011 [Ensete ventricosum]|nr:hypothetical protein GW17_00028011 [Ensete ventricosum]